VGQWSRRSSPASSTTLFSVGCSGLMVGCSPPFPFFDRVRVQGSPPDSFYSTETARPFHLRFSPAPLFPIPSTLAPCLPFFSHLHPFAGATSHGEDSVSSSTFSGGARPTPFSRAHLGFYRKVDIANLSSFLSSTRPNCVPERFRPLFPSMNAATFPSFSLSTD